MSVYPGARRVVAYMDTEIKKLTALPSPAD
jgi:hypothetical protein